MHGPSIAFGKSLSNPSNDMTSSIIIISATLLFGMVAIFDAPRGILYSIGIIVMALGMWIMLTIGGHYDYENRQTTRPRAAIHRHDWQGGDARKSPHE